MPVGMKNNGPRTIAFVISSLEAGGAERVCVELANYWALHDWQVVIITLSSAGRDFYVLDGRVSRVRLSDESRSGGATSLASLTPLGRNLRKAVDLRHALLSIRPHVALSLMDRNNVLLALAAVGLPGTICIGTEHIFPPRAPMGRVWSALRFLTYRRLAAVVALTSETSEWLCLHTGIHHAPVIPNSVPWPVLPAEPVVAPPPKSHGRLLCVGRLTQQKGFDLFLPCFARLAARNPGWDLVILGEGSERPLLEAMVRDLGIRDSVVLAGRVGNVGDWYRDADVFVMPSRFEGFPMTLLEAMAHGCPTVSFDCDTGPRDIIRDGVDGILVPDGDVSLLEVALQRLIDDPNARRQLGVRATEIRTRFSIESVVRMWEALFANILIPADAQ